jgi:LysR family hydrogen peroxide-inducible transcriptional activator
MQIQDLERELGAVLLERTRQGVRLTELGEEIARRTAVILAQIDELADYAQHGQRLLTGPLRLGVIPTIAPYILPKLLPLVREHHPDLDLHLRETQTQYLIDDLVAGRLHVALLSLPLEHQEIETQCLFEDAFVLALHKKRPLPMKAAASIEMLENDRLLLLEEGHCMRDQALSFCSMKQVEKLSTFGTSSLSTIVQMVANGYGVTLLPRMSIEVEVKHGEVQLLAFEQPEPKRIIGLGWRISSPRKKDFVELGKLIKAAVGIAPYQKKA